MLVSLKHCKFTVFHYESKFALLQVILALSKGNVHSDHYVQVQQGCENTPFWTKPLQTIVKC